MAKKLILFFIIFLFLFCYSVTSIGYKGHIPDICFEPGQEIDIELGIVNDDSNEIHVKKTGNFAQYLALEADTIQLDKDPIFRSKLMLPHQMQNSFEIIRVTFTPKKEFGAVAAGARVSAAVEIKIYKCIDAPSVILESFKTSYLRNTIYFTAKRKNNGNKDIDKLITTINIYDSEKNRVKTLTNSESLEKGARNTFNLNIPATDFLPGNYSANIEINYDMIESLQILTADFEIKEFANEPKETNQVNAPKTMQSAPTQNVASLPIKQQITSENTGKNSLLVYVALIASIIAIAAVSFIVGLFAGKKFFLIE